MTRKEAMSELNNGECLFHPDLGFSVMMEANEGVCYFEVMSVINGMNGNVEGKYINFEDFIEMVVGLEEGWIRFS